MSPGVLGVVWVLENRTRNEKTTRLGGSKRADGVGALLKYYYKAAGSEFLSHGSHSATVDNGFATPKTRQSGVPQTPPSMTANLQKSWRLANGPH
jgi:hypothetical protein